MTYMFFDCSEYFILKFLKENSEFLGDLLWKKVFFQNNIKNVFFWVESPISSL